MRNLFIKEAKVNAKEFNWKDKERWRNFKVCYAVESVIHFLQGILILNSAKNAKIFYIVSLAQSNSMKNVDIASLIR